MGSHLLQLQVRINKLWLNFKKLTIINLTLKAFKLISRITPFPIAKIIGINDPDEGYLG